MAFIIECELNQDRDPKLAFGTGTKVVFDHRYDGHYAQFTVKGVVIPDAIWTLIRACDDVDEQSTFFVTNSTGQQSAWTFDDQGELVRDEDF